MAPVLARPAVLKYIKPCRTKGKGYQWLCLRPFSRHPSGVHHKTVDLRTGLEALSDAIYKPACAFSTNRNSFSSIDETLLPNRRVVLIWVASEFTFLGGIAAALCISVLVCDRSESLNSPENDTTQSIPKTKFSKIA